MPVVDGRERDLLGRQVPQRVSWVTLFRAVPGLAERFKEVPANYWQRGIGRACVHCPCGLVPIVAEGESVTCECERIYLLATVVWVANSPVRTPAADVD